MRLAVLVQDRYLSGEREVSRVFGSGGGKRQRTIETSSTALGLPRAIAHASLSRPVYAVSLVSNLERAAVLNEDPCWLAMPYNDVRADCGTAAREYEHDALTTWKRRWWPAVERRVAAAGRHA
jgi:hypothetical protein